MQCCIEESGLLWNGFGVEEGKGGDKEKYLNKAVLDNRKSWK